MSSGSIGLEDLKIDQDAQVEASGEDGDADWIADLIDRLDERGYLDALVRQSLDLEGGPVPTESPDDSDSGGGGEVDAEAVAEFGKLVVDQFGDIPMSQVIKFAESNPEQVNQAIEQAMSGGGGE